MENNSEVFQRSKRVPLSKLLLDPNNYRFIDHAKYQYVADDKLADEGVQNRTLRFISGEKNKELNDLIQSFKANGFLEVDQIQVQAVENDRYRVLEGNRRVATLRLLQIEHKQGFDIGNLDPSTFSKVPVIIVNQQAKGEHEMIMALKHITGNKPWPTLNQAQLLYDLHHQYQWGERQICEALGVTLHKLRRDLRTIELIQHYKQSDYHDQFRTDMFAIFRELISSTSIKNWINWNDNDKKPKNGVNTERLYSWLSEVEKFREDEDGNEVSYTEEPIITKSGEVGTLAKILDDEEALRQMEKTRSISLAYGVSNHVGVDKYNNAISNVEQQLKEAHAFSSYAPSHSREQLLQVKNQIEGLLVTQGHKSVINEVAKTAELLCDFASNQFSSITFLGFKGFPNGLKVEGFNRINLIAGDNNAGKTSFLEAIYLLANLNDFNGLLNAYRQRGKFTTGVSGGWLAEAIHHSFNLSATFDGKPVSLTIQRTAEESGQINRADYLFSLGYQSSFNHEHFNTNARVYGDRPPELYFEKSRHICRNAFSSPFFLADKKKIAKYYDTAVEKGCFRQVVDFIREEIDPQLTAIERTGDGDDLRFIVTHNDFTQPLDLTEFGEGLQRIFYIGILMASAEKGILCIDEIENAIHYSLLVKFNKFLQILAHTFHVQLFVTTHSKECIDAFFANNYQNNAITGFRLRKGPNGLAVQKGAGEQLHRQIEHFQLDLRAK